MGWFSKKKDPAPMDWKGVKSIEQVIRDIEMQMEMREKELLEKERTYRNMAVQAMSNPRSGNRTSSQPVYHSGSVGNSSGYTYGNKTTTYPPKTTSASGGSWQLEDAPRPYQDESLILADHIDKLEAKVRELQDLLEATAGGINERLSDIEEDLYGA